MLALRTVTYCTENEETPIDSIAFQTNILALNAAVEAARAEKQVQSIVGLTNATNPLESEATQLHTLMVTFRLVANDSAAP